MTDNNDHHEAGTTDRTVTSRQAEARRENGRKSRGPVTEAGRARSATNAVKHGAWASTETIVRRGLLGEDPEEAKWFFDAVVVGLAAETDMDHLLALEVAVAMWRHRRVLRYEVTGLARDGTRERAYIVLKNYEFRRAIENFDEAIAGRGDIEALTVLAVCIAQHPDLSGCSWWDDGPIPDLVTLNADIRRWIEQTWGSSEDCRTWLRATSEGHNRQLTVLEEDLVVKAVQDVMTGDFSERLRRADAHASREIDRAIDRHFKYRRRTEEGLKPA